MDSQEPQKSVYSREERVLKQARSLLAEHFTDFVIIARATSPDSSTKNLLLWTQSDATWARGAFASVREAYIENSRELDLNEEENRE